MSHTYDIYEMLYYYALLFSLLLASAAAITLMRYMLPPLLKTLRYAVTLLLTPAYVDAAFTCHAAEDGTLHAGYAFHIFITRLLHYFRRWHYAAYVDYDDITTLYAIRHAPILPLRHFRYADTPLRHYHLWLRLLISRCFSKTDITLSLILRRWLSLCFIAEPRRLLRRHDAAAALLLLRHYAIIFRTAAALSADTDDDAAKKRWYDKAKRRYAARHGWYFRYWW